MLPPYRRIVHPQTSEAMLRLLDALAPSYEPRLRYLDPEGTLRVLLSMLVSAERIGRGVIPSPDLKGTVWKGRADTLDAAGIRWGEWRGTLILCPRWTEAANTALHDASSMQRAAVLYALRVDRTYQDGVALALDASMPAAVAYSTAYLAAEQVGRCAT